ncbi:MAG TPA: PcfK-like family protein [Oscillospiraceae bacterium]|nr:PcfK-like family protein [Oscillospiraceae bacterium]
MSMENEIIQKAIDKIDTEADRMKDDTAVRITSYIIDNYITSTENAEKVMNKTLSDCISSVRSKAKKQAKNGYAMIEDRTVWNWVKDFYEFVTDEVVETQATAPAKEPKEEPGQQGPVNLLDFL